VQQRPNRSVLSALRATATVAPTTKSYLPRFQSAQARVALQPKTPVPTFQEKGAAVGSAKLAAVPSSVRERSDDEIFNMVEAGKMRFFNLENDLERDFKRYPLPACSVWLCSSAHHVLCGRCVCRSAVEARRYIVEKKTGQKIGALAYEHYDYQNVWGQCCEVSPPSLSVSSVCVGRR
jgi:hypothetical protein